MFHAANRAVQVSPKAQRRASAQQALACLQAAELGDLEAVQKGLVQSRVDVNAVDRWGRTALMIAANRRYADIVTYLLSMPHIRVNTQDLKGQTALHHAVSAKKAVKLTPLRLRTRADIRQQAAQEDIALSEQLRIVQALSTCMDVTTQDQQGRTALAICQQRFNTGLMVKRRKAQLVTLAKLLQLQTDAQVQLSSALSSFKYLAQTPDCVGSFLSLSRSRCPSPESVNMKRVYRDEWYERIFTLMAIRARLQCQSREEQPDQVSLLRQPVSFVNIPDELLWAIVFYMVPTELGHIQQTFLSGISDQWAKPRALDAQASH